MSETLAGFKPPYIETDNFDISPVHTMTISFLFFFFCLHAAGVFLSLVPFLHAGRILCVLLKNFISLSFSFFLSTASLLVSVTDSRLECQHCLDLHMTWHCHVLRELKVSRAKEPQEACHEKKKVEYLYGFLKLKFPPLCFVCVYVYVRVWVSECMHACMHSYTCVYVVVCQRWAGPLAPYPGFTPRLSAVLTYSQEEYKDRYCRRALTWPSRWWETPATKGTNKWNSLFRNISLWVCFEWH